MNSSLLIWICVASLASIVMIVRIVSSMRHRGKTSETSHNFIELGHECEEFFIPGDRSIYENEYDYDDIEDL